MPDTGLERLTATDTDTMLGALNAAGLPTHDLNLEAMAVYAFRPHGEVVGWAAIEQHGPDALLRSVLVAEDGRSRGVGSDMVRAVVGEARTVGVGRLWLLTETAAPFFRRVGFTSADRASAPAAIQATSEFRGVCPASAECMVMDLRRP